MRVYLVTNTDGEVTVYKDAASIKDEAVSLDFGEEITVTASEMTEEEFANLPSD